jgi:hypothetical protein
MPTDNETNETKLLHASKSGPFVDMNWIIQHQSSSLEDAPSVAESEISSLASDYDFQSVDEASLAAPLRIPLQWEFKGLTLWIEYEEFDQDLTRAIDFAVHVYGTEKIPVPHSTAIYGMTKYTVEQARELLHKIPDILPKWPSVMEEPRGVTCDIAVEGRPGQVCSVAWSELSLRTNESHERALDSLHELFDVPARKGPWTPHISLAYDNPEDAVLSVEDTIAYVSAHPTLMWSRQVKAISLWDTNGKMADWQCLDRVHFQV